MVDGPRPEVRFAAPDVCLDLQDAARCGQDGVKLDPISFWDPFKGFGHVHKCSTSHRYLSKCLTPHLHLNTARAWGVGAPQQLALGSAIRVRVGLGPPAYTCKYVYMHEMLQAQLLKPAMCIEGWPGRIKMKDLRRGLWKQLVPMACF